MDTAEIRFNNFKFLFGKFRDEHSHLPLRGMLKLFAEKLELSDRYLSHVKNGRKNIGANIARQIEKRLKLPHGWMDVPHRRVEPSDDLEKNFLETALALYRLAPEEARTLMVDFLRNRLGGVQK